MKVFDFSIFSKKLKNFDPYLIIIFIFIVLYIFFFTSFSFMQYFSFNPGNELCVLHRHIFLMSQGRIFNGILEYEKGFGAAHFYMVFWVLLPAYFVFPNPLTLLFLQTSFLAIGAIPIYLLARDKLNSKLAGIILAVCYLLYPALQNINLFEFHAVALAVPFLLWSFYFMEKNDMKKSLVFIVLSMMCKETVALAVILMGFYALIKNKNEKLGMTIIFLGSFWAFFSLFVMFPYTYDGRPYFNAWAWRWGHIGETAPDVAVNFIKDPIYPLAYDLPAKVEYLIALFSPLGFLSLLSPGTMLIVIHELILHLSSGKYPMYYLNHYTAVLIPFIFISAILGIRFIQSKIRIKPIFYLILFFILVTSIISNLSFSKEPITSYGERLNQIINFEISDHDMLLLKIIDTIPKNSTLAVDVRLCPQSSNIKKVYFLHDYVENSEGMYKNVTVDFILFDNTKKSFDTEVEDRLSEILSKEFVIYNNTDEIFLYKHV
ncbi:MAG: DUF2079 domain-containing protein [Candidatus Aenigmarchaeota archaeon]|nr:DUF2079 domain-containing protein [Candidatus Aenigmarchaeota archaeon]